MAAPGFIVSDDIPFAPGSSPFHGKGVLYVDAIAYYGEHFPGGWNAVVAGIDDPRQRAFLLTQSFVVGGWYDVFPIVTVHRTAARLVGQPYLECLRKLGHWQIDRELRGIYRFMLRLGTPDMVVKSLPRLGKSYYDFLRVEIRQVGPRTYESYAYGVPSAVAPSYMVTTEIAVLLAMEVTGARNVRHRWLPPIPDGEAHGIPVLRLAREVSWA